MNIWWHKFHRYDFHNKNRRSQGGARGGNSPPKNLTLSKLQKLNRIEKREPNDICWRVFWAFSASEMHLTPGLRPEPRWESLQCAVRPLASPQEPLLAFGFRPRILAPGVPPPRQTMPIIRCAFCKLKMHQNPFSAGALPAGRAYDAPPDPLVGWGREHLFPIPLPFAFAVSISGPVS